MPLHISFVGNICLTWFSRLETTSYYIFSKSQFFNFSQSAAIAKSTNATKIFKKDQPETLKFQNNLSTFWLKRVGYQNQHVISLNGILHLGFRLTLPRSNRR